MHTPRRVCARYRKFSQESFHPSDTKALEEVPLPHACKPPDKVEPPEESRVGASASLGAGEVDGFSIRADLLPLAAPTTTTDGASETPKRRCFT